MKNLRGVIFDLDGVLVNTDELHYQAWKSVADRLGIPFSKSDNDQLRGVSRAESLEILLALGNAEVSPTEKEVLAAEKNTIYRGLLRELSARNVEPGVYETLEELRRCGIRIAIGSSSKNAKYILERIGLRTAFDAISDGENISRSKPHPEVFLMAADFLALSPSECAVVEDARAGVEAAIVGGFSCFAIGDAATHPKATWRIDCLTDILDYNF